MSIRPGFWITLAALVFPTFASAQDEGGGGTAHVYMANSEGYASRPLTLPAGRLRVDLGPSDYGYMDSGELNTNRGFRVLKPDGGSAIVGFGMGAGYGVTDELEVGTLLLPFIFAPDFDFGDIELYGRYGLTHGQWEVAVQATVQIPTDTDFGLGLGAPVLLELAPGVRLDSGAELELVFANDFRANLDIPAAFNFDLGYSAFIGPRTGLFFPDFRHMYIPAGVQGGFTINGIVDLTASFLWPAFLNTQDGFELGTFEVILGGNFYMDIFAG